MFDAASGGMDFALGCALAPAGPSSNGAARRAGPVSPHRGRPYTSLHRRSDLRRVRRTGSRKRVGGVIAVSAAGNPGQPRIAVVAGRKVGTAVARNRAKRRLREAAMRVPVPGGRDYILTAEPAVNEASFGELTAWVAGAVDAQEEAEE